MGQKTTIKLTPFKVEYECDKCKLGYCYPTGNAKYAIEPIQIEHKCRNCGEIINLEDKYPMVRFLE